ncbi:MAG: glycoside hydrolase family 127 protein [Bacteroidales bacterium]|nr:glycoside hydrolase family 127 protein [Bacteroidales bacterium]
MNKILLIVGLLTVGCVLKAASDGTPVTQPVKLQAEAFPLQRVQLTDGSKWRRNQQLDSAWICSFPVTRLLHSFQTTAGAWAALEGGYSGKQKVEKLGGWESLDCDLRGHAIGHLLSAYALMYANTRQEIFKLKGDSLVAGLRECQETIGTGYLSAFPEGLLKRNLKGTSVWAPWYTIHKIMAGLLQQYRLSGNETALAICKDFSAWATRFLSEENLNRYTDGKAPSAEAVRQRALRNEFGGIGEAFYDLYALTGNADDLRNARFFYHNEKTDPLYARDFNMGTQHCNTFLPKTAAELRSYQLGLPKNPHAAASDVSAYEMVNAFWHEMIGHHVLAPGCLSDKEHFFDPATTSKHLTGNTGETCCTYNLLKLTRELYALNPADATYFDYYERALMNHILGQQDPETGMVHYFLPTQTGAYKLYSTYDQSFWCCVGSSFESHSKYAESVYWHNPGNDSLYVNLFIPTQLDWQERGIVLRQETRFPQEETTRLKVSGSGKFTMLLRKPSWAGTVSVRVNGKKASAKTDKAGYVVLRRNWKDGDVVEYTMPMSLRTEATPDDPHRVAVFYGPVLLAGQLGTEEMNCWSDPQKHNDYYGYDYAVPASLRSVLLDLSQLKRQDGLMWMTQDGIPVKPLYETHRQRYVIYWQTH